MAGPERVALQGEAYARLNAEYLATFERGQYEEALTLALRGTEQFPEHFYFWMQASICALYLRRWAVAADYGERALLFPGAGFSLFDSLAHAYGELKQPDKVREFGAKALAQRDIQFGLNKPVPDLRLLDRPAPPSPATRMHNVIAFSLFGDRSKYCECAVLNAVVCPEIYPGWQCVVYVDGSVPAHVLTHLEAAGARVERVPEIAAQWPGPMWRLLAADLPGVHRVIFRDADSLISHREAAAVSEWVASDRRFHIIRDSGSHTELLLAGLWGMVGGALPPMAAMVNDYLASPVQSTHFADQWFLRDRVWPYVRQSLMSHDSQFGFMDARPLTVASPHANFHVGSPDGAALVTVRTALAHGVAAHWTLWDHRDASAGRREVCRYPVAIQHGIALFELPFYYAAMIRDGRMAIEVVADGAVGTFVADQSFEALKQTFNDQFQALDFEAALASAVLGTQRFADVAYFWTSAALCCTRLRRWGDALHWGEQALDKPNLGFNLFDALAFAAWSLGDMARTRRYGHRALGLRDQQFGSLASPPAMPRADVPPVPKPQRAASQVIAFSLFGDLPKYVDTAILNAQHCAAIYPGWVCRFYVDGSVPAEAVIWLRELGAHVVEVDGAAAQWPGAMWRLLAADDPTVDRVLFRDADAVVSRREADAVQTWVASDRRFHMMRDAGSHTELIMAGMWGAVVGALPPLRPLIESYLAQKDVRGFARHYADQWFLRSSVWPYVRQSLMTHDNLFGFGEVQAFHTAPAAPRLHVGDCEGGYTFNHSCGIAGGTRVHWFAHEAGDRSRKCTVTHSAVVGASGHVSVALPREYVQAWRQGRVVIHVEPVSRAVFPAT